LDPTDGTFNYTYDNEGNTTRRTRIVGGQVTEYTWDHRNRMTSVIDRVSATGSKTQQVEYVYDAFDQLTGKRVSTQFDTTPPNNVTNWSRYELFAWANGQEVLHFVDSRW
jgi:YD repeat-containing protein